MDPSEVAGDPSFDRYARLVRRLLGVPTALVSIVEENRQVFPGAVGLPEPYQLARQTPLTHSFCQYVVHDDRPLVISDARLDPRLADNLAIRDLAVIAYAGWPLRDRTGRPIGSLCAIDSEPRDWTEDDLVMLEELAEACAAELQYRELSREATAETRVAELVAEHRRLLLTLSEGLAATRTLPEIAGCLDEIARTHLGCSDAAIWIADSATAIDAMRDPAAARGVLELVEPSRGVAPAPGSRAGLRIDARHPVGDAYRRRRALLFEDAGERADAYPSVAIRTGDGSASAFLPLVVGPDVFGAVELAWPHARSFTPEDRLTLSTLTDYTAAAVQRGLLLQERVDASTILQTAMLTELPTVADLELAARYRPAALREQVGGDWYDAIAFGSEGTALIIGDVVGHDIAAAADMGQLRNMLRTLAWADDGAPADILGRLDGTLAGLGSRAIATAVYGRLSPTGVFAWSNAGHPPPLLVQPDGSARFLTGERADPLLNALVPRPRSQAQVEVEPGSTLLLYTDGLVERRGEILDRGLSRLAASASRHQDRDIDSFLDAILSDLLPHQRSDDVAVVAARTPREA